MEKRKVVTGINEIDQDLRNNELERGEVHLFIHATNDAKSLTLISMNCHNAKIGNNTFHLGFEGKRLRTASQVLSNLAGIPYKRFMGVENLKTVQDKDPNFFSEAEILAINSTKEITGRIEVSHQVAYSTTESLEMTIREAYRKKPMDLVTLDHFQLIMTDKAFPDKHRETDYILRRLNLLAEELNVAIVAAFSATRPMCDHLTRKFKEGDERATFGLYELSELLDLNLIGTVVSCNRSRTERENGIVRFALEKQQNGVIGTQVSIASNFNKMNVFDGERITPNEKIPCDVYDYKNYTRRMIKKYGDKVVCMSENGFGDKRVSLQVGGVYTLDYLRRENGNSLKTTLFIKELPGVKFDMSYFKFKSELEEEI